ncbi:hypothetical protein OOK58_42990 [Streptomyces sp. NBC_01728]|uniref:hypothetical protein n=1 Tax=unclassified Streptomyces TaxID=2593676 RepID=UPI00225B344E|nr:MULTISPECIES: hypothetical protein [unclassified Streptomyces]MCX4458679.1 hypothetical protein [Streptomyces sp. NBC_01719]MCX4498036.1 hypothetical protein [Streptomyces sp. NBC_01728]
MATSSSVRIDADGFAVLPANVNLNAAASGTFVATGLVLALPSAGTYHLDATVRAFLGTMTTGEGAYIVARLYDVTAAAVVPDSEVLAHQLTVGAGTSGTLLNWNRTAPIQVRYTVPGARTIRLEAARFTQTGTTDSASVVSDGNGRTTLRYERVA